MPDLTVLVTSRAPLRVWGEQEYPVQPLGLPASTHNPSAEEVQESASGCLFAERARAASPAFEVTDQNAASVAAICWRLDGLPLALELAAARARFLDPASLLGRLDRALSGPAGRGDSSRRVRPSRWRSERRSTSPSASKGWLRSRRREANRSARLWGVAEAILEDIEVIAYPFAPDSTIRERHISEAKASLDEETWTFAWSEGRSLTPDEAVAYALGESGTSPVS